MEYNANVMAGEYLAYEHAIRRASEAVIQIVQPEVKYQLKAPAVGSLAARLALANGEN